MCAGAALVCLKGTVLVLKGVSVGVESAKRPRFAENARSRGMIL